MSEKKSVPTGVKVIAVIHYIGAVLGLLVGLLWIISAGHLGSSAIQVPIIGAIGVGLFIAGGIIFMSLGILAFFLGRGLWKAKPWARIVVIIFSALGVLMSIISITQGGIISSIPNLVIQGTIGGYLLFNNKVKQAFS